MTTVKTKFPCGYEEERSDWQWGTEELREMIQEDHDKYCKKCKHQKGR